MGTPLAASRRGEGWRSIAASQLPLVHMLASKVPAPIALRLYLPKESVDSEERRRTGGIPDGLGFRPKWHIALDEIERKERLAGGCPTACQ